MIRDLGGWGPLYGGLSVIENHRCHSFGEKKKGSRDVRVTTYRKIEPYEALTSAVTIYKTLIHIAFAIQLLFQFICLFIYYFTAVICIYVDNV